MKRCRLRDLGITIGRLSPGPKNSITDVRGVRVDEEHEAKHPPVYGLSHKAQTAGGAPPAVDQPFSVHCSGAAAERKQVESLYKALSEAKQKSGEKVSGNLDSFTAFVKKKTTEIRKQHGCDTVVYSVETQGGQVKLKAKAKS